MNTIILHGLGQTPEDWKTVREQLEKRNSKDTVFCPDMTEWIGKSQLCYDRLYAGLETYCGQIGGTYPVDLDLTGNLKQITCSTLILCGEKDWLNWPASRRLEKAIPHANAERILHAGHEVNKENADDAGEKMRKFLETV